MKTPWTVLFVAMLAAPVVYADCPHSASRQVTVPVAGAQRVRIVATAGTLKVLGSPRATAVVARGRACASSDRLVEQTELRGRRSGDEIVIEARTPDTHFQLGIWSSPRLDFVVELPSSLSVEVVDGSGDLAIQNVSALRLHDGSGDADISNIGGRVDVSDGSGDLRIVNVQGEVTVTDGSGDIFIDRAHGVRIVADGSGDISVRRIVKDVIVASDGSGSIDADEVGGDFEVSSDGSGGITHSHVQGHIRVPHDL